MLDSIDKRFTDILIEKGVLDAGGLARAEQTAQRTNEPLERVLIDSRAAPKDDVMWARAEELGKIYVDLSGRKVDVEIARIIPEMLARRHRLVCIGRVDRKITLAMADPSDIFALDDVRLRTGLYPEPVLSYVDDIDRALDSVYAAEDSQWQSIFGEAEDQFSYVTEEQPSPTEVVVDAPVVRLADLIIAQAITGGASDIHVEPHEREMVVRYRVDGVLRQAMNPPKAIQAALISRYKIMANLDIAEHRVPQDGRIVVANKLGRYDLRVAVLPTLWGESVTLRILDRKNVMVDLDELGFHPDVLEMWRSLIRRPNGVLLVTGPTSTGKSTTLYATLNTINSVEKKIVTIEDPVEYHIKGINQVQVSPRAGLTFATGLRAFLRQDPNVMMVGEIRDHETALIGVQSALTGHLVFSTLHTNDATSALTRLIDMGIEPFLLASAVVGVMAQRLVRTVCDSCKRHIKPAHAVLERFEEYKIPLGHLQLVKGIGCDNCNNSGYRGRAGIHELFVMTEQMQRLVLDRAPAVDLKKCAIAQGMRTMYHDGLLKVAKGVTTLEEVMRVAID